MKNYNCRRKQNSTKHSCHYQFLEIKPGVTKLGRHLQCRPKPGPNIFSTMIHVTAEEMHSYHSTVKNILLTKIRIQNDLDGVSSTFKRQN